MDNILRSIGKFWFPILCIISGVLLLFFAATGAEKASEGQPVEVFLGAACVLIVGILALLFLLDLIRKPVRIAVLLVGLLAAGFLLSKNVTGITGEMAAIAEAKRVQSTTIQAMKDVRTALETYRDVNGRYTDNLKELQQFVKSGTIPRIMKIGSLPDTIASEQEARELGLFIKMPKDMTTDEILAQGLLVRDTVAISVMKDKFDNDIARKGRIYPFDIENIVKAPISKKNWIIKTSMTMLGGVNTSVVEVTDPAPWKDSEALKFGTLTAANLNGNWDD